MKRNYQNVKKKTQIIIEVNINPADCIKIPNNYKSKKLKYKP